MDEKKARYRRVRIRELLRPTKVKVIRAKTMDWAAALEKSKEALKNSREILDDMKKVIQEQDEVDEEMSKQLDRLEYQFEKLNDSVTVIRVELGKIETRLESMVTRGQIGAWAAVVMAAIVGGGWWIVQTYLAPILTHIPK